MIVNSPMTRLLKTKMFTEQLVVRRKVDGPPGSWEAPVVQSKPIDEAINAWVDQTGNELVNTSPPSMFMQWMDAERTTRLVITAVMVTYVPSVPNPQLQETNLGRQVPPGWSPVNAGQQHGVASRSDEDRVLPGGGSP